MDILEQYGGLSGALMSILTLFFYVYSYRLHELNVLKEYESLENENNLSKTIYSAHAKKHFYWGV